MTIEFLNTKSDNKMIISHRPDGLGTRLMTLLITRYLAENLGRELKLKWPDIHSPYYGPNVLQRSSLYDIFDNGEVFIDTNLQIIEEEVYSNIERFHTRNLREIYLSNKLTISEFKSQILEHQCVVHEDPYLEFIEVDKDYSSKIKEYWQNLNWHKDLLMKYDAMKSTFDISNAVVIHLRRGDVASTFLHAQIDEINQRMLELCQRFFPIKTAYNMVVDCNLENVIICSECLKSASELKELLPNKNVILTFNTFPDNENKQAAFDLMLMSKSKLVIAPNTSFFSKCAEFGGETTLRTASFDWDNIYSELSIVLDKSDLSDEEKENRKSIICINIAKYLKENPTRINFYNNLAKKHSLSVFNQFVKKEINTNNLFNLALNKPTIQSSIYYPERYGYDFHGACNGNKTGKFGFCTLYEKQPWWQIDLQENCQISEIVIYNRTDCCQERARTLDIFLSTNCIDWELCYSNEQTNIFGGITGTGPLIVDINNTIARFVRLQLREDEYLHLDEVEVYGIPIEISFISSPKHILISSKGIIHIGANQGQEAEFYGIHNKSIIWIEALPEVFKILEQKITNYPNQKAINALVTDTDGKEYKFYISNNQDAVSSSLFDFGDGKNSLFPQLKMIDSITLVGKTLNTIYNEFNIEKELFDFLLLDVQGSELLVLKGSESILQNFKYILTEVSTVDIYKDGVLWDELKDFLNKRGFKEQIPNTPAKHCDVLFVNVNKIHDIYPNPGIREEFINHNLNNLFNLALNKPTIQSSIYDPDRYGYNFYGACNGDKTGKFGFCTLQENQPWWQVDLQGNCQISEIVVYNRTDCCQERARTLDIFLSTNCVDWELCYSNDQTNVFGGIIGKPLTVNFDNKVARFVRLQLRENEHLHLDEVEIYGIPLTNFDSQPGLSLTLDSLDSLETYDFIDYKSQLLQDKWVFMMTQGKKGGVFLEIGSTDGIELNNTFCLEKHLGWSGICVEPNPNYFKKLCVNRIATTLPYAFYKESGQIVEFVHHGVLGTISNFISTDLHSVSRENFIATNGTISVITARPDLILNLYKFPDNFDFLSLDVEGAELDVLESFNLSQFRPALACIEHNHVTDKRLAIFEILSSYGYQRIECKFDDWYYNLDVLQILNPEIPLSHYKRVLQYFCAYHECKFVD